MLKAIHRVIAILPAVLLQFLWWHLIYNVFRQYAQIINFLLSIAAFLLVIWMVVKRTDSTYRILWLLILLLFPLPGAFLYLLFGDKRSGIPLKKKLDKTIIDYHVQDDIYHEGIQKKHLRMSQSIKYLSDQTQMPLLPMKDAKYYPLGNDLYVDLLEDLKKAEKTILIEYFIVEDGQMWEGIEKILEEKVKQGVKVYFMYDDLGSLSTFSRHELKELKKKGIHAISFNPLMKITGTLNYRDHRKMTIIDGKVCYSGGINLADEYINVIVKHGHWKDIGFRLTGAPVYNYTKMFLQFWNAFSNEKIDLETITYEQPQEYAQGYCMSWYDSPLSEEAHSNQFFIDCLNQATSYVYFYTPYLMLGDELLEAFTDAARRGVDVRIIVPGIPDKKVIYRMSQSYYPPLLKAGVKIYSYTKGFVHAKAMMVDDIVCTIGTVNLDYRSLFLHFENNSMFYDSHMLIDLKQDFLTTQAQCKEEKIGRYGTIRFVTDGILRILSPLC